MIATCDEKLQHSVQCMLQCANGKPQSIRMWVVFIDFLPLSLMQLVANTSQLTVFTHNKRGCGPEAAEAVSAHQ